MQQQFCGYLISWLMIGRLSRYMCDYSAPEGKLADCCSWSWWAASLIQIRTATEEPVSWHQSIDEPTGKELKGGPLDWDTGLTLKKGHRSQIWLMSHGNALLLPEGIKTKTHQGFEVLIPSQDQDQGRTWPSQPHTAWHLQTIVTHSWKLFFIYPFCCHLCYICVCVPWAVSW